MLGDLGMMRAHILGHDSMRFPATSLRRFGPLLLVLLALLTARPAAAAEPFALATTPGLLPKTVVPLHYAVELKPDLAAATFAGQVMIDIEVHEPTAEIILNALDLRLETATVAEQSAQITQDVAAQIATLRLAQPLPAGTHTLRIAYAGRINSYGRGLFYVDYPVEGGRKRMLATHFEPSDARRLIPSWDEPAFKATFAATVTVPDAFLAVSNMPAARESAAGPGLKRVEFAATPRMSSYLFVLAAGELEQLSGDADGTTISVVTTLGKREQGRYALDSAIKLLRYYNDYFGVRYPLPKLDLIAVPGGMSGAMENWGGIVFFESRLLFDPRWSPNVARRWIFSILAHEIAHQWFGNLVTMGWWDDLWLNEGFASWMDPKATQVLNPAWPVWLDIAGGTQWAMKQDARPTTHAIQHPVRDQSEVLSAFDSITYTKGRAIIRQLEAYLGENAFRTGIRQYMQTRAYGNATTADLWNALQAASGKPVAEIAAGFTEQPGLPLIVSEASCVGGETRLALRQERLSLRDPVMHSEQWSVPIAYRAVGAAAAESLLLRDKSTTLAVAGCGRPIKLNSGDVGYYRVQCDDATMAALTQAFAQLPREDRANLLADTWALVEAARVAPERFMALAEAAGPGDDRAVWEQAIRTYTYLDFLERGRPTRPALQAYLRGRLRPVFERLGWDRKQGEPIDDGLLRTRIIRVLGELGDEGVLAEARRRFATFQKDPASLRPALRDPVFRLAGRDADRATYDALLALARKATNTEERSRYYTALAGARDPALAQETLRIALSDELPPNLAGGLIWTVASGGEQTALAWSFIKANLDALVARHGVDYRDNQIPYLLTNSADPATAAELRAFTPVLQTGGGRVNAARAEDDILTHADIVARQLPAIETWIRRRAAP
jgi:aminopeptidase N